MQGFGKKTKVPEKVELEVSTPRAYIRLLVSVLNTDTMLSVKKQIFEQEGVEVAQQSLFFRGQPLSNRETVGNSGVSPTHNKLQLEVSLHLDSRGLDDAKCIKLLRKHLSHATSHVFLQNNQIGREGFCELFQIIHRLQWSKHQPEPSTQPNKGLKFDQDLSKVLPSNNSEQNQLPLLLELTTIDISHNNGRDNLDDSLQELAQLLMATDDDSTAQRTGIGHRLECLIDFSHTKLLADFNI